MSTSVSVIIGILIALGYLVAPVTLIWGWIAWAAQAKSYTAPAVLSFLGFSLATSSALLACSTIVYAQFHHFPYYDPLLLRIFRLGILLSLGALISGLIGMGKRNSLRWHAPISGLATLAFWIMAAVGE